MSQFIVKNEGKSIVDTNFWGSEMEHAGRIYCSTNAGAVRLLLPRSMLAMLDECRTADYVILSRGPWPEEGQKDAVELLFEDRTESPYAMHLTANSFDLVPGEPTAGREWSLSIWTGTNGRPEMAMQLPCKWRRSKRLPDLSPWSS
jgi:hypothetical protein